MSTVLWPSSDRARRQVPTVNKRVWKVHMYCGTCAWSEDRHQYYDGKQVRPIAAAIAMPNPYG